MKQMGVQDSALMKSLGVLAIVLAVLFSLIIVYLLVKLMKNCTRIREALEKKLFYSSFLRYMIVSNLKLTYTNFAFLLSSYSFATTMEGAKTTAYMIALAGICVWPFFIVIFMIKNQHKLEDPQFARKWDALYAGFQTDKLISLFYNAVFCLRRFDIVLVNMIFSPGFPGTNFSQH